MKRFAAILSALVLAAPAAGAMVVERWSVSAPAAHPKTMSISQEKAGTVINLDLSALPDDAKILRADLWIWRTRPITGLDDEALVDVDIRPVEFPPPPASMRRIAGPLEVRPPWHDRLDATDAVRAIVKRGPGGFLVRACPLWQAEATCLDIHYEGTPRQVPPQVTGVRAFHSAGQTFITWKEIEDAVGKGQIPWGELKAILDALDKNRRVRYCVYRHDKPISAENLHQAELIATVKPLSCWNVNGRNLDRAVDHYIVTADQLMCGHWNPFWQAEMDGKYGEDCPMDRFVVPSPAGGPDAAEPLPSGTGLYVHTRGPAADTRAGDAKTQAYYAVLTGVDGTVNTRDVSDANSLRQPVLEQPGEGVPVLQRALPRMPLFNYDEQRLHYVRWVGPACGNGPSQYFNWTVGVPNSLGEAAEARQRGSDSSRPRGLVPLELSLHRDGHSYWRTQFRIERDSIVVSPHDFPVRTWWYGHHESLGTLKSFRQGAIRPYTERRLLAFIDWACRTWGVDRNRIMVTGCRGGAGGSGPLHLGLRHPDVFNLVIAGHPIVDYATTCAAEDKRSVAYAEQMQQIWGKLKWDLKTDRGANVWAEHDMIVAAAALPAAATVPYVTMGSNHGDSPTRRFYHVMLKKGFGIMASFHWGGTRYVPVSATGTYPNVIRLDIRRDRPLLAFRTARAVDSVARRAMGDFNLHLRWRDVADRAERFEATLLAVGRRSEVADVTLRRCRNFRPAGGVTCAWTNTGGGQGRDAIDQAGQATVGADGLLTLEGVKLSGEGSRLAIAAKGQPTGANP